MARKDNVVKNRATEKKNNTQTQSMNRLAMNGKILMQLKSRECPARKSCPGAALPNV